MKRPEFGQYSTGLIESIKARPVPFAFGWLGFIILFLLVMSDGPCFSGLCRIVRDHSFKILLLGIIPVYWAIKVNKKRKVRAQLDAQNDTSVDERPVQKRSPHRKSGWEKFMRARKKETVSEPVTPVPEPESAKPADTSNEPTESEIEALFDASDAAADSTKKSDDQPLADTSSDHELVNHVLRTEPIVPEPGHDYVASQDEVVREEPKKKQFRKHKPVDSKRSWGILFSLLGSLLLLFTAYHIYEFISAGLGHRLFMTEEEFLLPFAGVLFQLAGLILLRKKKRAPKERDLETGKRDYQSNRVYDGSRYSKSKYQSANDPGDRVTIKDYK